MLAAGPAAVPLMPRGDGGRLAGRPCGRLPARSWRRSPATYFNMRKTTIYGGSNEVQRNIVAQTVLGS